MSREQETNMFRFENLEIWKRSVSLTDQLFNLSDKLEKMHHYRFGEQLRGAALSISNNIAEGSGSSSKKDFRQYLNYAHRSVFETVSMITIARRRNYISENERSSLHSELEEISKMITGFSKSL